LADDEARPERFMEIMRTQRLSGEMPDAAYRIMRRIMVKEFDGHIADLVPVALADVSQQVRKNAISAIAGILDPEAFPILLALFMDPKEPLRDTAAEAMRYFFSNLPQSTFLNEELTDRFGKYCLDALAHPERAPDHRARYIGWLGKLNYRPAESIVRGYARDAVRQRDRATVHVAVVALSQMGSPHYEDLALSEETRAVMLLGNKIKSDYAWFQLLREIMASSERVKIVVKEIVLSGDMGSAKGFRRIPARMGLEAALDLGDKECLDMIWGMRDADGNFPLWVVGYLTDYPRTYVRSPEEERLLLEAIKKMDKTLDMLRRIRRTPSDRIKEGSIYHWLASPDSPLDLTEPEPTSQKSPLKVPPNKQ
jgi:hypothetical protein